jgi:hypothetical protein
MSSVGGANRSVREALRDCFLNTGSVREYGLQAVKVSQIPYPILYYDIACL